MIQKTNPREEHALGVYSVQQVSRTGVQDSHDLTVEKCNKPVHYVCILYTCLYMFVIYSLSGSLGACWLPQERSLLVISFLTWLVAAAGLTVLMWMGLDAFQMQGLAAVSLMICMLS